MTIYNAYKSYALQQSKIDPYSWNFKRNSAYTNVLEHVTLNKVINT